MGIEYKISISGYNRKFYEHSIEKLLSAIDGKKEEKNGSIEITFGPRESGMPDVVIQQTEKKEEILFIYNGGQMEAWAVLGLLTSLLTAYAHGVHVEEI